MCLLYCEFFWSTALSGWGLESVFPLPPPALAALSDFSSSRPASPPVGEARELGGLGATTVAGGPFLLREVSARARRGERACVSSPGEDGGLGKGFSDRHVGQEAGEAR